MEERIVQYSERSDTREETETAVAPAPMVERAFRLLDLLSDTEEGLTLSDLARALNMSKGSIHGLLKTLEGNGVIEHAEIFRDRGAGQRLVIGRESERHLQRAERGKIQP